MHDIITTKYTAGENSIYGVAMINYQINLTLANGGGDVNSVRFLDVSAVHDGASFAQLLVKKN